jgi:predicted deacylase
VIERRILRFEHALLRGLEHPAFEARGSSSGLRLTLLGGVHGCEYSSIAAVTRVMRELDTTGLAGTITAVPVVSLQSFRQRSAFVVPEDGKNLNRCFPGSFDEGYTDALARGIFETLIESADLVIDLHGGDLVEALEPFTLYEEGPVEARARDLALAFGLPYVVRQRRSSGLGGMTASAAAQAGVPAIIAEAGGRGQLEETAVRTLVDGVFNVLRAAGMLAESPTPPRPGMRSVGEFVWLRCDQEGWWEATVEPGEEVEAGAPLGAIGNLWGDVLEEIRAPRAGVVLFLTTSPAVAAGGLLLGLGCDLAPIAASPRHRVRAKPDFRP